MEDIQEQLTLLRRKIARINRKYASPAEPAPAPPPIVEDRKPARYFVENLMSGEVVANALGEHFETEKLWERHRRHGSVDISRPGGVCPRTCWHRSPTAPSRCAHPTRWAFLDTETTGLAGGTGTYAFLIGVGSIDAEGFRLRQFFMRDYGEEASLLYRLGRATWRSSTC